VICGAGKNFSGGADLDWMQKSSGLSYIDNVKEAEKLSALFSDLYELPVPTIALVHGAAFGGAVGVIACCDWAIAVDGAKFCLSEVRVGLVAAVILPYLAARMLPGDLRRLVHTGSVFDAATARAAGLVQRTAPAGGADVALKEELSQVLMGEPNIQRIFKQNHRKICEGVEKEWTRHLAVGIETIAKARVSETGQAGIRAFLSKQPPEWAIRLPDDWRLP
jgi:methylglutaconyl-CoA hydratase